MKKFFVVLFVSIITQISLKAQIDIKSKVDAETYSKYSKAIDLFEQKVNPNDVITLFIPENISLRIFLGQNIYDDIFVNNNSIATNNFFNNHSISTFLTYDFLNQKVITSNLEHSEIFKSNTKYNFVKNGPFVMLTDKLSFETNIGNPIQLSSNIFIYFIHRPIKN